MADDKPAVGPTPAPSGTIPERESSRKTVTTVLSNAGSPAVSVRASNAFVSVSSAAARGASVDPNDPATPPVATSLRFTVSQSVMNTGETVSCTVEILDQFDNVLLSATPTANFSVSGVTGTFVPGQQVVAEAGVATATFTPTSPGLAVVRVDVSSLSAIATVNVNVDQTPVLDSLKVTVPGTAYAATSAIYTAQLQDQFGNPLNGTENVTFVVTGVTGSWILGPTVTTDATGLATVRFDSDLTSYGDTTVSASIPSGEIGGAGYVTVPLSPVGLVVARGPVTTSENVAASVRFYAYNDLGTGDLSVSTDVTLSSDLPGTFATNPLTTGTGVNAGIVSTTFTPTATGSGFVTASAPGLPPTNLSITVTQATPVATDVTISPQNATTDDGVGQLYTANIVDQYGQTFNSTATVTFASDLAGSWDNATPSAVAGVATATFTPSAAGSANITASALGLTPAEATLTVNAVEQATSLNVLTPTVVMDDNQTVTYEVEILDNLGARDTSATNEVTFSAPVAGTWDDSSPLAVAGVATATFTPSATGTGSVSVTASGLTGDSASLTVSAYAGAIATLTLTDNGGDADYIIEPGAFSITHNLTESASPVANRLVKATLPSGTIDDVQYYTDASGNVSITGSLPATSGAYTLTTTSVESESVATTLHVVDDTLRFNAAADEGQEGGTTHYRIKAIASTGDKTWAVGDFASGYHEKAAGWGYNQSLGKYVWDLADFTAFPSFEGLQGDVDIAIATRDATGNLTVTEVAEDAYFWSPSIGGGGSNPVITAPATVTQLHDDQTNTAITYTEPNGNNVTLSLVGAESWMGVTDNLDGTGTLDCNPTANVATGTYQVTVRGTDDVNSLFGDAVVDVTVTRDAVFQEDGNNDFVIDAKHYSAIGDNGTGTNFTLDNSAEFGTQIGDYWVNTPNTGFYSTTLTGPFVEYKLNVVTAGTYYLHTKGACSALAVESFYWTLDGVNVLPTSATMGAITWQWDGHHAVTITGTGTLVLRIYQRERDVAYDKLVVTRNAAFSTTGDGPTSSTRVAS